MVNPTMQRYPPSPMDDILDCEKEEEALQKELEKEKPRRDVVVQLLRITFASRRHHILNQSAKETVMQMTQRCKALMLSYGVSLQLAQCIKISHLQVVPLPPPSPPSLNKK